MNHQSIIYVAGHAGLIGSAVVRRLHSAGYHRIVTRRRSELDLQDEGGVSEFFNQVRPDYVVFAAGRVGGIVENQAFPADFMDENLTIQLNVLKAARRGGLQKFIFFGSSCMYPRECAQPMSEKALLSGWLEPTSLPYAMSKLTGVHLCLAYNKQDGANRFLPLIPNSVYGPYDNFDPESGHVLAALLAKFHQAKVAGAKSVMLWGSGTPRREFIHADDIAGACLHLLEMGNNEIELPINVGVGSDISIKELADLIAGIVGYKGSLEWDCSKPDGCPRKLLESARMHALGWKSTVGLADGLAATYEWYLKNLESLKFGNDRRSCHPA
jgi:GDP-L-fucose synthase